MSHRQNDLGVDCPSIRSLWSETMRSESPQFSKLSTRQSLFREESSPSSHPSLSARPASPDGKNLFGGYHCGSPSAQRHTIADLDVPHFPSKKTYPSLGARGSLPSLWENAMTAPYQKRQSFSAALDEDSRGYFHDDSPQIFESARGHPSMQSNSNYPMLEILKKAVRAVMQNENLGEQECEEAVRKLLCPKTQPRRSTVCGAPLDRETRALTQRFERMGFPYSDSSYDSSQSGASGYESALEAIEREAKSRRTSALHTTTAFTWKGILTTRYHQNPTYATKVFVGGLPYDVTPEALTELFGKFGLMSVQFPPRGRGHAYLVFETEQQVQDLLNACENKGPGQFFHWVASRRGKDRQAQIIPWATEDSDWLAPVESGSTSPTPSISSDSSDFPESSSNGSFALKSDSSSKSSRDLNATYKQNTVFVGALHGEITAEGLQKILSELFGPVVHIGIDTDRCHYPSGSARATFENRQSFHRAVSAEFVHVVTPRFSKTIQLDAYIEDGACSVCKLSTPVFCRHPECFRYYCPPCFEEHRKPYNNEYHPPVMRNRNNNYSSNTSSAGGSFCSQRSSKDRGQGF